LSQRLAAFEVGRGEFDDSPYGTHSCGTPRLPGHTLFGDLEPRQQTSYSSTDYPPNFSYSGEVYTD
jgi:hypothetical protein